MAKVTGVGSQLSGKVGQIIFRNTKYGTVAYEAPAKPSVPLRTEAQMQIRTQWSNLAAVYKMFNSTLKKGFEGIGNTMSDYNAFIQANTNVVRVYVPKYVRLNGGSVLAPYQITRGSLPSIAMAKNGSGVLVTDIALGSLVIGDSTTVAEFSAAVLAYNDDWANGDQLTFFYGQQSVDAVTSIPRAKITGYRVVLDTTDTSLLMGVVSALGFTTVDNKLGMGLAISESAAVWIHSRDASGSDLKVSTQYMYVDSTVLAMFQGDAAFGGAAGSYGGINTSAVYLQPVRLGGQSVAPSANSGSSTPGGSDTPSQNEPAEQNEPETVAAPSFSGETPFAESTQVTMTGPDGASIYYTLDGSTPTSASTLYESPVTLTETTIVKAVAIKNDVSSTVTERTYTKGTPGGMDQN